MDFAEASQKFTELQTKRNEGRISEPQFRAAVDQLRLRDRSGTWWALDFRNGGWLSWNGTAWVPAHTGQAASAAAPPVPVSGPAQGNDDKKLMDIDTFRRIGRNTPWHQRPQKWWDLFSILGGITAAVVWFIYSGVRSSSEGLDLLSPLLMIGIPVFMVTYRAQLDDILIPLQPRRKKFPRLLLIGAGIAVPFLTAFLLYNVFFIRNYPLMHWNMLIGTFTAYALTREPVLARGYQAPRRLPLKVPLFLFLFCSVLIWIVSADHCLTDPLNAQDCLRSQGFAEVIAGTASSAASTAINGPEIVRTLSQQQPPPPPDGTDGSDWARTPEEKAEAARQKEEREKEIAEFWKDSEQEKAREEAEKHRGLIQNPETGDWMTPEVAQQVARERAEPGIRDEMIRRLEDMQTEVRYGDHVFGNRAVHEDAAIERMLSQLRSGGDIDMEQYNRIYGAFRNDVMGNTLRDWEIPQQDPPREGWSGWLQDTVEDYTDVAGEAIAYSVKEVVTGRDADGNTSVSGIGGRIIAGILSGGTTEFIFTPGSAVFTMQDKINQGVGDGDSDLEAGLKVWGWAVCQDVLLPEGIQRGISFAGGRALEWVARNYPDMAEEVAEKVLRGWEFVNKPVNFSRDGGNILIDVGGDSASRAVSQSADDLTNAVKPGSGDAEITLRSRAEQIKNLQQNGMDDAVNAIKQRAATGEIGPGLKDARFVPAQDADVEKLLAGIPEKTRKAIEMNADNTGMMPFVRPSEAGPVPDIEAGRLGTKPVSVKSNTLDAIDGELGFPDVTKKVSACRDPLLPSRTPDMSDEYWDAILGRYNQRKIDFIDHYEDLVKLRDDGVITWDPDGDGIIRDAVTGKSLAPDPDMLAVVNPTTTVTDPLTGAQKTVFIDGSTPFTAKPASPYMENRFTQGILTDGAGNHPPEFGWDVTKGAELKGPPGSPEYNAAVSKNLAVDNRILNAHRPPGSDFIPDVGAPGGKPVLGYNPGTKKWFAAYCDTGMRKV